jgi:hypothetical protein
VELCIERRRELSTQLVTLDGSPARIIGIQRDFALVVSLDGRTEAEWSWQSAALVCESGGQFRT